VVVAEVGTVALLSVVTVALGSGVVGDVSVTDGVGCAGVALVSGVTGCASCAIKGVEESARAAAIAGRALVRANRLVLVIMRNNRARGPWSHHYRPAEP
jgi:hypothetical protein